MRWTSRIAATASLVGSGLMLAAGAFAQTAVPAGTPRSAAVASTSKGALTGRLDLNPLTTTVGPRAAAKVSRIASPGLKVTLDGSGSSGGRVWYRWVQSQGPLVVIQGADQPSAHFVAPEDGSVLGFVLVVGNSAGIDARSVQVEIANPDQDEPGSPLKADAGPAQVATVGRRVVLDGIKSEPKGRVRFRWVQTSGPPVSDLAANGSVCSFVPAGKGTYQFALLVVGADALISEASVVKVEAKPAPAGTSAGASADRPPLAIDELARTALFSVDGGAKYAASLSKEFDGVADRIDSFKTYLETGTEITRRLDAIIPRNPERRGEWLDRFFKPWTDQLGAALRADGIDVSLPAGQVKVLTRPQRARLAEQLRLTAAGLRGGASLR